MKGSEFLEPTPFPPSVKPGKQFLYFDPIASLDPEHRWRWTQPTERRAMIDAALADRGSV